MEGGEAAAADIAAAGQDDGKRVADGNRRIDGIATAFRISAPTSDARCWAVTTMPFSASRRRRGDGAGRSRNPGEKRGEGKSNADHAGLPVLTPWRTGLRRPAEPKRVPRRRRFHPTRYWGGQAPRIGNLGRAGRGLQRPGRRGSIAGDEFPTSEAEEWWRAPVVGARRRELLKLRLKDLDLSVEGTWLEGCLEELYDELEQRGICDPAACLAVGRMVQPRHHAGHRHSRSISPIRA